MACLPACLLGWVDGLGGWVSGWRSTPQCTSSCCCDPAVRALPAVIVVSAAGFGLCAPLCCSARRADHPRAGRHRGRRHASNLYAMGARSAQPHGWVQRLQPRRWQPRQLRSLSVLQRPPGRTVWRCHPAACVATLLHRPAAALALDLAAGLRSPTNSHPPTPLASYRLHN